MSKTLLLPGDGNWYRALVKEILPSGNVKVHFVDYGNVEEVTTDQLQAVLPPFLLLPFQGMQCWLVGRCQRECLNSLENKHCVTFRY